MPKSKSERKRRKTCFDDLDIYNEEPDKEINGLNSLSAFEVTNSEKPTEANW